MQCPRTPEEGISSLSVRVAGGCEPPTWVPGNQTQVPGKQQTLFSTKSCLRPSPSLSNSHVSIVGEACFVLSLKPLSAVKNPGLT